MTAPATTCDCPVLPDLSEISAADLEKIIGGPLRCASCGHELELRCPEGHLHRALKVPRAPNGRRPFKWQPKACVDCGNRFLPTGGRDVRCPSCKEKRR